MRVPSWLHRNESRGDQAMTSMIDCVFLLLIFFVCASVGQLREASLATELPSGGIAASVPEPEVRVLEDVWVKLKRQADVTVAEVNGRDFDDLESLEETLRALADAAPEIPVILAIDPMVPLGDLISVYDVCRSARFESIQFAADAARLKR